MLRLAKRAAAAAAFACLLCLPLVCGSASAAPAWLAPTNLSPVGASLTSSSMAVDSAGRATAVWGRSMGDGYVVVAAVHPSSAGWQAPVDISGRHAEGVGSPQVAVDARGDAIAVWSQGGKSPYFYLTAQAAVRSAGAAWHKPVPLTAASVGSESPVAAVDVQGNATAVSHLLSGDFTTLQAAGYDAAGPLLRGVSIPSTRRTGQALSFSVSPLDA